ncbi:hypothetical protein TCAP_06810 [Tolypocladium capitatum]|uniref:Uncharacterized protein n=1 Tax=Tolypocladium capitatum TaxID=45235 RepID=A0A2K3Q6Z7_9HYPO|nr:hypothetical protein TCAP_06810 [Tolypocladium capitatum]
MRRANAVLFWTSGEEAATLPETRLVLREPGRALGHSLIVIRVCSPVESRRTNGKEARNRPEQSRAALVLWQPIFDLNEQLKNETMKLAVKSLLLLA